MPYLRRCLAASYAALIACAFAGDCAAAEIARYATRISHDADGIGKFYMDREIAQVMDADGIHWLERSARADEEQPRMLMEALQLHGGETVADLGAGSGYFTFKLANAVGPRGAVLAVDIEPKMLDFIRARAAKENQTNIGLVKATEMNPKLPANRLDLVLLVDVYHELSFPYEVMRHVYASLKPKGRVALVEYRAEDGNVPIKRVHKMSERQIIAELQAAGFKHLATNAILPQQHLVFFGK